MAGAPAVLAENDPRLKIPGVIEVILGPAGLVARRHRAVEVHLQVALEEVEVAVPTSQPEVDAPENAAHQAADVEQVLPGVGRHGRGLLEGVELLEPAP